MPIPATQAQQIVIDCIDEVSDSNEPYATNKRLGQFAIISDKRVRAFAREVGGNEVVGVKAYGYRIPAKELLDISSETITGDIETIIITKSVLATQPTPAKAKAKPKSAKKVRAKKKSTP